MCTNIASRALCRSTRASTLRPILFTLIACLCGCVLPALYGARAQTPVLTQHNDNARTGANLTETQLTPTAVNATTFGKLFTRTLDANVNGQVLYVPAVTINGVVHNVIYASTSNNSDGSPCSAYAFDADDPAAVAPLWHHPFTNSARWTTCTPVIDPSTKTMYVLTKDNNDTGATSLRALDITTGNEKTGSPIVISASVPGTGDGSVNGVVSFDTSHANCRPGLLLLSGRVYIAFAHNSDSFPYHGWLLGYSYDQTKFTQTAVFCTNPNGGEDGIWMAGKGLAADANNNIYCTTGNGTFDLTSGGSSYGMCVLKLGTPNLNVIDWFAPFDQQGLSNQDLDLGNSGALGIPGTTRIFAGGTKFGSIFLLDSTNLGHFTPAGPDKVLQRFDSVMSNNNVGQNAVCWDASALKYVYLWPNGTGLLQYKYDPAVGKFNPAGVYKQTTNTAGGSMTVTANGSSGGILWAVGNDHIIHAYDATDLTKPELWNSNTNLARDGLTSVGHFQFPMVANGKVYVPSGSSSIVVYGLLPANTPPPAPTGVTATAGNAQVTLNWTAVSGAATYNVYRATTAGGEGTTPFKTGVTTANFTDTGLTNGTTYFYKVSAVNSVGESPQSLEVNATPAASANSAVFVKTDAGTQGSWKGVYGADGYSVFGDSASVPAYASVSISGNFSYTWAASTADVRGLQKAASATDRIASCIGTFSTFTYDLNLTDGLVHQVAFYNLDWDNANGRSQSIQIFDAATNALLDSQNVTAFSPGKYLVWNIKGHVSIQITNTAGNTTNAVISGVFFDPNGGGAPHAPTTPTGVTATASNAQVTLNWTPVSNATTYNVYRATTAGAEGTTPFKTGVTTANFTDTGLTNGTTYFYKVSAVNSIGESPLSLEVNATPAASANSAVFVKTDAGTQGSWKGVYGADGYSVFGDSASVPAYASVSISGNFSYTWAASTADVRGLQKAASTTDRIASCIGSFSTFSYDLNLTDSLVHQVAIYCLDWDNANGRSQTIQIFDAATNALLDSQSVTAFSPGKYLVWNIKGHVSIQITNTAGNTTNAVISGVFFK